MTTKQPGDLERARDFLDALCAELDLDAQILHETMPHLLGMTKHVAHDIVRPAAPLAAFLVGLAAASASPQQVKEKIAIVEKTVKDFVSGQA